MNKKVEKSLEIYDVAEEKVKNIVAENYGDRIKSDKDLHLLLFALAPLTEVGGLVNAVMLEGNTDRMVAALALMAATNDALVKFCQHSKHAGLNSVLTEYASCATQYIEYFDKSLFNSDMTDVAIKDFAIDVCKEIRKITDSLLSDNQ